MASTQTENNRPLLPLEKAGTLAPRLASAFFLDNALTELESKKDELTEQEYEIALELICSALGALQDEICEA